MTATLAKEVRKLSVSEKIRLAEDLWDAVAAAEETLPVPSSHKRLLDARLAAHRLAPEQTLSLDEFRRQLARRL